MFNTAVCFIPPFSKELADKRMACEGAVRGTSDDSLFMTLSALLYKRWPDFKISNKYLLVSDPAKCMRLLEGPPGWIKIRWVSANECPDSYLQDFEPALMHDAFFKEKLGRNVWIRLFKLQNTIAVFSPRIDLPLIHLVQSFFPAFFRQYFEALPRTEEETNLLKALSKSTDTEYRKEIENFLTDQDFRRFLMKASLQNFESSIRRKKYNDVMNRVHSVADSMERCLNEYRAYCEDKITLEAQADGLLAAVNSVENNTELEDYLCENKNITDVEIKDDHIRFIVTTFVNPYLPDDWDSLSARGSIFQNYPRTNTCLDDEENLKLLLDAVFSRHHSLKLRVCGFIDMAYYGQSVSSQTGYDYTGKNPNLKNYVPNGHLNKHNCFGQNMPDILTQLKDNDLIGAIECCINVVKRINVSESMSFRPFVEWIKQCKGKCIVTEDGREMTCKEAVEYLKEKKDEALSDGSGEEIVA